MNIFININLRTNVYNIASSDAVLQVEYDTTFSYLIVDSEGNTIDVPDTYTDHITQDSYLNSIPPFFVYS